MSDPHKAQIESPEGGALDQLRDEATEDKVRDQMDRDRLKTMKEAADDAASEQGVGEAGGKSSGDVKN